MLEPTPETIRYYRTCFSTESGRRVLANILIECGVFDDDLKTDTDIARRNLGITILHNLGIYNRSNLTQQERYVDKLFEIPIEGI